MTDRPILFSAPMIRALLAGAKTQTRRALRWETTQPVPENATWAPDNGFKPNRRVGQTWALHSPYGDARLLHGIHKVKYQRGDRLWVREAFSYDELDIDRDGTLRPWYWADGNIADADQGSGNFTRPKPSIHMPRWASRITLHVTDVRVERLQDISFLDTIAEGVECATCEAMGESNCNQKGCFASRNAYRDLWNTINGPGAWQANPWVVALTFRVQHRNIDA